MGRDFIRSQLRILTKMAVGASALSLTIGAVSAIDRNDAQERAEVAQQEAHFWQVVAGEAPGSSPTVDNRLARDLSEILGDTDAINDFRGSSNLYGGISSEIGFDPFDGTGQSCVECGPLDQEVRENLALIDAGRLEDVLTPLDVDVPSTGLEFTPFGWSVSSSLLVLWLLGGPVAFFGAARQDEGWEDGLREAGDAEKIQLIALAPTLFLPVMVWSHVHNKRLRRKLERTFPDLVHELDSIDSQLDRLPQTDQVKEIRKFRDDVFVELRSQATGEDLSDDQVQDLQRKLEDANVWLKHRKEALDGE